MKSPLLLTMPGNGAMGDLLASELDAERRVIETLRFPDQESYVTIDGDPKDRVVVLLCTLDRPDDKILPLLFAADAARELGAIQVGLAAPYLAYMRQDKRFAPGEAVTSRTFARILSQSFDWLATVDPHLHRIKSLSEIFTIPTSVAHAADALARWIRANVEDPFLLGPDAESTQWVADTAAKTDAPYAIFEKRRTGASTVQVDLNNGSSIGDRTPVLLDDIVSTGQTLMEAAKLVRAMAARPPVCAVVHGIFSAGALEGLTSLGCAVVTSNTVAHETNRVDVAIDLAKAISDRISRGKWSG